MVIPLVWVFLMSEVPLFGSAFQVQGSGELDFNGVEARQQEGGSFVDTISPQLYTPLTEENA